LSRENRLLVIDPLPAETAINSEKRTASVYDVSPNSSRKRVLQLNPLDGTLQQVNETNTVPMIPSQQFLRVERDLVPCRNSRTSAGTQG